MTWSRKIRSWLLRGEQEAAGITRRIVRIGLLVFLTVREFRRDRCLERAAALSFATILSLIPIAVLFFSFAGMLGGGERIIGYVQEEIFPLVAPEFHDQLNSWLDDNISKSAFKEGPTKVINVTALVALLMAAMGLLVTAERYFNIIWDVKTKRSYVQKATAFWVVLTISPLLIAASMSIGEFLVPEGGWVETVTQEYRFVGVFYRFMVPVVIGFFAFATVYIFLPGTRVRIVSGLVGGLVAAVLWELSKFGFFIYVARATTVTSFYGQLATVPLFLVWVYVTWLITLVGAEVSYVHQNLYGLLRVLGLTDGTERHTKVFLGLQILSRLKDAFDRGVPAPNLADVAGDLSTSNDSIVSVATLLGEKGYLVQDAADHERFVLSRSPDAIHLKDVATDLLEAEFLEEHAAAHEGLNGRGSDADRWISHAWDGFLDSLDGRMLDGMKEADPVGEPASESE